jgi:hypothetical protein
VDECQGPVATTIWSSAALSRGEKMTCAEFQKVLPDIIDGGGDEQQQLHLETCPVCSDLLADLRYIAECAKLLVPMEDPGPRVWEGIPQSLQHEGRVKPGRRPL